MLEDKTPQAINALIFSFFSGAGFLDLGFEAEGFELAYVNEIHSPFLSAYQHSRAKLGISPPRYGYHNGSITELLLGHSKALAHLVQSAKTAGDTIGFIGGPPCPGFSVAGKNKGKAGEHGKLSQTYVQLICEQLPDFFVFENVKGLYRTTKHRAFFNTLKAQLTEAGYVCTERLINAIEYGVPQDRERIILFGIRSSKTASILQFNWQAGVKYPDRTAFAFTWPDRVQPDHQWAELCLDAPQELTVQHWFELNEVTSHPNARHHFQPRAGLKKFQTVLEGDDSKKSYKRLHRSRYSPTAAYGHNEVHIHPYLPRRISVAEALAIQSLPKAFELPNNMSLTDMFKTVGNGVPFLAAKGIALAIKHFLLGESVYLAHPFVQRSAVLSID